MSPIAPFAPPGLTTRSAVVKSSQAGTEHVSEVCVLWALSWRPLPVSESRTKLLLRVRKEEEVKGQPRQLSLYETATESWIARLWKTVGFDRRQEVLMILGEMARHALVNQPKPTKGGQENAPR